MQDTRNSEIAEITIPWISILYRPIDWTWIDGMVDGSSP